MKEHEYLYKPTRNIYLIQGDSVYLKDSFQRQIVCGFTPETYLDHIKTYPDRWQKITNTPPRKKEYVHGM